MVKNFKKDTNDVVLDFPYKDCVLEGGKAQKKGTDTYFEYLKKLNNTKKNKDKRKEIFSILFWLTMR